MQDFASFELSRPVSSKVHDTENISSSFKDFFPCAIIDPSGTYNLAFRISANALANIKHEATISLRSLSSGQIHGFESVFMTPVLFWNKYDQVGSLTWIVFTYI